MFKKIALVMLYLTLSTIIAFAQLSGDYTTHNLFYRPGYGSSGLIEFQEFNDYLEIADAQIWANKLAFGDYYLKTEMDTEAELEGILTDVTDLYTDNDFTIADYLLIANVVDWTVSQTPAVIHADNYTDTDTQLTEEEVEDYVGGMVTGNTETLITVAYQDADGTIDFAVDDNLDNYDNTFSEFIGSDISDLTSIVFEGATANEYQLTFTIPDVTADRTITFPDATGTVSLTSDLDLYYLKTAIDTIGEVETIYGVNITTSTEMATALSDYYLKTAIDTLPEVEAIYTANIIDDTELATALGDYILTTEIGTSVQAQNDNLQGLANWGPAEGTIIIGDGVSALPIFGTVQVFSSDDTPLLLYERGGLEADVSAYSGLVKISGGATSQVTDNSATWDTALQDITGENFADLSDIPAHPGVATKVLETTADGYAYIDTPSGGGGASELSDLSDVGVTTATDKNALMADGDSWESRAISSDDLSDVASIAMLDEAEEVTGEWYFKSVFSVFKESDTLYPKFYFLRMRDGDPTYNVANGDILGWFDFSGYYNDVVGGGASIGCYVDGVTGVNDIPGRLEFLTTPDGSATPVLRTAIDNAGNFKHGDGVWTNYVNISNAGVLTLEGTANIEGVDATEFSYLDGVTSDIQDQLGLRYLKTEMDTFAELDAIVADKTLVNTTNKLSAFAATTSAELASVISDEIGAGKLRFDTAVTAKTTTATLTEAEAGTILVSAAAAYTITLPTAVGNTGLTYHFIKTDANYNLITLDGDGTETLNYENSTGAPTLTYARLNTYCAEATVVSNGANWQVMNEKLGQVPECSAYLGAIQSNITNAAWVLITVDTENYDIGNNFNTGTYKFVAPIPGKYSFKVNAMWDGASVIATKGYAVAGFKNDAIIMDLYAYVHSSLANDIIIQSAGIISLVATDYLTMKVYHAAGANTPDIQALGITSLQVRLVSKD